MRKSASATLVVAVSMAAVWTAAFVSARAQDSRLHPRDDAPD